MWLRALKSYVCGKSGTAQRDEPCRSRLRIRFRPDAEGMRLEPRIALSQESTQGFEIAYIGDVGASYTGPTYVYLAGGSNPIDAEEWASYTPPEGYLKNTTRNVQFNSGTFLTSPDSTTGLTYITTSDGYTWSFVAQTVSANWPFDAADYPDAEYTSGYEAAALNTTPPPGVIKWSDNTKNQEITWDANDADGQPIERYFITDAWGNRFIMQASGETDPALVQSNFLSAVLPAGWTESIGHLKTSLTTLPAYAADGTAHYSIFRDSADDSFQQISWGKSGLGTPLFIPNMVIWGSGNADTIRAAPARNNVIYGATGNDTIDVSGLVNTIHGDGGRDTAVFRGRRSRYTVTADKASDGSEVVVVRRRGPVGATHVTTLYGVERIRFSDRLLLTRRMLRGRGL
jgi:hypothetical protein